MRWVWAGIVAVMGAWTAWRGAPWLMGGPVAPVSVGQGDPARGAHLGAAVLGCTACHGADLGGGVVHQGVWFGTVNAPDLTPSGSCCADWTPETWAAVLRSGRTPAGRPLRWMPSWRWAAMSDHDLADVVAWLTTVPPAGRPAPEGRPGPGAWWSLLAGAPPSHAVSPVGALRAPDALYGAYLGTLAGCTDCHGPQLEGQVLGAGPVPPAPSWTGADFARSVLVEGDALAHVDLPVGDYSGLDLTEADALWLWAKSAGSR